VDWSEAWKYILPIALPILGFFGRSWRNQWKGPKDLLDFCERHIHPEAENIRLRYRNFRLTRDKEFLTNQLAERDRQVDQLVEMVAEQSKTASSLESSVASVAAEISAHPPHPRPTPTSRPRSRRRSGSLPTRRK